MNKLLYFLLFFASLGANAQVRPKVYSPNSTTRNTVIVRGGQRIDSVFTIPFRDTTYTPERSGDMVIRPGDNLMYIYIAGVWYPFQNFVKNIYVTNGLTALNDSTIGYGGRLSKNDTISGRGTFGLLHDSLTSFVIRGPTNIAPDASALLQVVSTTKGAIFSKMNSAQMNAIISPASGLLIYNTDSISYCYYTGAVWLKIGSGVAAGTPGLDAVLAVNQNLSANRVSNFVGFNWELDGTSNTAPTLNIVQSGTAPAILATADATGATSIRSHVQNGNAYDAIATSGTAFNGAVTTGNGFFINMTDGVGGIFQANSTLGNQIQNFIFLEHTSSATASPGIGGAIVWANKDAGGGLTSDGSITESLYTTTAGNKGSQLKINLVTGGGALGQIVAIDGIGGVQVTGTNSGGSFAGAVSGINISSTATGTGGIPANIINRTTNTNQVVNGVFLERQGGGNVGAVGEGIGIWSNMVDAAGTIFNTGQMNFVVSTATAGAGNQTTDAVFRLAILGSGETEVLRIKGTTKSIFFTQIVSMGNFANNAAAITGGLAAGDVYRNGDVLMVVH